MTNEHILERVRRLLALAESNNVNEAANAAAKASELLHQHNLALEDVPVDRQPLDEYGLESVDYEGQANWRRELLQSVALANNATTIYYSGTKHGKILGRQHEREITIWLYGYLAREIQRLAKAEYRTVDARAYCSTRTWYNSFYLGAVRQIGRRLRDLRRERMAEANSRALVLNREGLLRQAQARLQPNLSRPTSTKGTYDGTAYAQGRRAAEGISINPGVSGGTARHQLGSM